MQNVPLRKMNPGIRGDKPVVKEYSLLSPARKDKDDRLYVNKEEEEYCW